MRFRTMLKFIVRFSCLLGATSTLIKAEPKPIQNRYRTDTNRTRYPENSPENSPKDFGVDSDQPLYYKERNGN